MKSSVHADVDNKTDVCSADTFGYAANIQNESPNSIDVLAIGDSNIYRSFSPLIYWKEKKVTSYALSSPSQAAWLSYYQLLDAVTYQNPKVLLLEVNQLFTNPKGKKERMSKSINSLKSDTVRLNAINDNSSQFTKEEKDFLYKNYVTEKFKKNRDKFMGEETKEDKAKGDKNKKDKTKKQKSVGFKGYIVNVTQKPLANEKKNYMDQEKTTIPVNENASLYFENIIKLCEKHNIQLVLVKFPTAEWSYGKQTTVEKFASDRKIPYLDLNTSMKYSNIDWNNDTYDGGNHLNDMGAEKTTIEIANYLEQNFKLTPTKNDKAITSFETSLQVYEKQRNLMINTNYKKDIEEKNID
ncbi:MAG: hypothetical protein RR986_03265 [Longicatena sp.]